MLVNGQLFTTITAGDPRADLGPYNGHHGLNWAIPVAWKDGQGRTLQLGSQGTVLDVNANAGANSNGAATVNGNTVTLTCAPNAQKALYFIEPDHLGTPRNVQNQTQQTVWRWDKAEAFGNNAPNENPSNLGAFVFPLRFPGQYADVETGLFYNYFRDYSPLEGRYRQFDPVGLRGGVNGYLYVNAIPTKLTDPSGEIVPVVVFAAMKGAAVGAGINAGIQFAANVAAQAKDAEALMIMDTYFKAAKCVDLTGVAIGAAIGATGLPGFGAAAGIFWQAAVGKVAWPAAGRTIGEYSIGAVTGTAWNKTLPDVTVGDVTSGCDCKNMGFSGAFGSLKGLFF